MLSARAALCLVALALPLLPGLALAQRGVEFGYKDRIFEQTYVLPEGVTGAQLIRQQAQAAMTIGLPGFASDPRLIDAMGGQCVATFMREANAEATMQSVPLTPTQAALERLPAEARVAGPDSAQDTTAQMLAEASPQEACLAQEMLFRAAFEDSLATDRQLANLAQQMRQRFAGVWMTPAQVRDPAFRLGAQRARLMGLRARRLQAIDPTKVGLSAQGMTADLIAVMRQMADTPTFEQMAAELTALEAEMLEEALARSGKGEQRRKAEDAARETAAASPANTPSAGQPMAAGDGECRPGGTCPVLSLTLFCRTPQQLVAILSQRPGPGRKQVLNVLSASGDCRQVPAGQPLQWTAPMVVVHPRGEPAAELVPGTLQDGMQGFMLRDGVMPRTRDAAR